MSKNPLSIEELVSLIQKGNKDLFPKLFSSVIHFVQYRIIECLKHYNIPQMYFDDLFDETMDGLLEAVKGFKVNNNKSFLNYFWTILERKFILFYEKRVRERINYYDPFQIDNYLNRFTDFSEIYEEPKVDLITVIKTVAKNNISIFTSLEKQFLFLYLDYESKEDIMKKLSWNKAKYYRVRKTVIEKLNKCFK